MKKASLYKLYKLSNIKKWMTRIASIGVLLYETLVFIMKKDYITFSGMIDMFVLPNFTFIPTFNLDNIKKNSMYFYTLVATIKSMPIYYMYIFMKLLKELVTI